MSRRTKAAKPAKAKVSAELPSEIEVESRELELADFDLPAAIDNALPLTVGHQRHTG